jgi:outer membrane protein assembly factor BamD (BamD/ComL family)
LTNQVLAYAKQHPQDPRVPQALHLAIRSTRFGCTNAETSRLSKTAFDFLHERYPQSEWTAKTKYYY